MANRAISVLKYLISLGLAAFLLYFAFRNIELDGLWAKAKTVDYIWVFISIGLSLFSYYVRAYRWNILLRPLGYEKLNIYRIMLAVLVGYLANLAFPRLGEVTRCGMLKRNDDVPVSTSLGTVITERIVDILSLLVLVIFVLFAEYDRFILLLRGTVSGLKNIEGLFWKAGIGLVSLGVVFLAVFYLFIRNSPKVKEFFLQILEGILSLRKIDNLFGFLASTIILWVAYYFMSYTIVFSIPETSDLTWMVGVMLLTTSGIALAIPVQGGIGTYHALVSSMFVLYVVERTTGVFLATLLHTSQMIATVVFGGIALLISVFIKKKSAHGSYTTENSD